MSSILLPLITTPIHYKRTIGPRKTVSIARGMKTTSSTNASSSSSSSSALKEKESKLETKPTSKNTDGDDEYGDANRRTITPPKRLKEDARWRKWIGLPSKNCLESMPIICAHCNQKLTARDVPYGVDVSRYSSRRRSTNVEDENDQEEEEEEESEWESIVRRKFVQLSRDAETDAFLLRSSRRPRLVNARLAQACTRLREKEGKSLTEANAILGRGKMFVLSREQARVLVGRSLMHRHRGGEEGGEGDDDDDNAVVDGGAYLDIGSGQGEVASKLGEYFGTVVATETSPAMVKRCAESHKDWTVLETGTIEDVWEKFKMQNAREEEDGTSTKSEAAKKKVRELLDEEEGIETTEHQHQGHGGKFDCIGMFNVLDRCDRPFTMLSHVRNLLKPKTGLFVLAVVLPFRPFVELDDGTRRPPSEKLDVATPTAAWEYGCRDLYENVLKPSGFEIEKISRAPYVSEGDHLAGAYVLDDVVFVLRRTAEV
jgi:hypothetical protein